MKLSIIIVGFKNNQVLSTLLTSINSKLLLSKPSKKEKDISFFTVLNKDWEVIIVDNSKINRGFGAACNLGASKAQGEQLFFLNPDSIVTPEAIDQLLVARKKASKKVGVLAPQLVDSNGVVYSSFCAQPSFSSAFIVYSIFNKWLQHSKTVQDQWLGFFPFEPIDTSKKVTWPSNNKLGSASGAALLIPRNLFYEVGGFDERFFIYWEELDLNKRIINSGYELQYLPNVQVIHEGGGVSPKNDWYLKIWFKKTRFRFFEKHFGFWKGEILDTWFQVLEEWRLVLLILSALSIRLVAIQYLLWLQVRSLQLYSLDVMGAHLVSIFGVASVGLSYIFFTKHRNKTLASIVSLIFAFFPVFIWLDIQASFFSVFTVISIIILWVIYNYKDHRVDWSQVLYFD